MAPMIRAVPTAQEWFIVHMHEQSGKAAPLILRINIRSACIQAYRQHEQDVSFEVPVSDIEHISPDFSSARPDLHIRRHSSPAAVVVFSFESDRKRDNFFIFVSKLRRAPVDDLGELLCTVFYGGTFVESSMMGMKHMSHPAVVHGSDIIVWKSPQDSVPYRIFDLSFAADDADAILQIFKEGSGHSFTISTPGAKETYSVASAGEREIVRTALTMACSYRYLPPEHADDVEQELARRTSIIELAEGVEVGNAGHATDILATLRAKVSLNKRRFADGDFDLDLSYVLPQVIAMGFPSEGKEAMYRNPMSEVKRFLSSRHSLANCRVYNLCSERSYDAQQFEGNVVTIPFDDHNPPLFEQVLQFCTDCHQWYVPPHPSAALAPS